MASQRFQKFLEDGNTAVNPVPPKRAKKIGGISGLATKFESPEIREARKKKEEEEVREFLEKERIKQAEEAKERAKRMEEKRRREEEEMERVRKEEEERRKEEEAQKRIAERRRQREEEEKRLAQLKPAQAIFERGKQARESVKVEEKPSETASVPNTSGAVKDMKEKLAKKKKQEERDFAKELMEMTEKALMEEEGMDEERSRSIAKSGSGVEVYTRGACSNLKSAFEVAIADKKKGPSVPPPLSRRQSVQGKAGRSSSNLPNMFQQKEKKEAEFRKQKQETKQNIPMDKKIFTNFLDKFEDERSRKEAKVQLQKLTQQQKEKQKAAWVLREEEKRRKREEEERKRKAEEEEKRWRLEMERKEWERLRQREMEEKKRKQKEEEERRKKEVAAAKAAKKKKKKEVVKKPVAEPNKELPKIIAPTATKMKQKLQDSLQGGRKKTAAGSGASVMSVGKLTINPFDKPVVKTNSEVIIPEVKGRELSDIKRKYARLASEEEKQQQQRQQRQRVNRKSSFVKKVVVSPDKGVGGAEDKTKEAHNDKASSSSGEAKKKTEPVIDKPEEAKEVTVKSEVKPEVAETEQRKQKKSKEDMQNYLLTHLLFDQAKESVEKLKKSIEDFEADIGPVELDPEYVKEMEMYLAFIEDTPKKKKATKKTKKDVPKLKIVEVNNLKNQFEKKKQAMDPRFNDISRSNSKDIEYSPVDQKVGKFKDFFEKDKENDSNARRGQQLREPRKTKMISNDLLSKFDCPEMTEQLRKQRQSEREERRQRRLEKLELERIMKEEEEKIERMRKEEARREALRQEQRRREEEERLEQERMVEEERRRAAYEAMVREQQEKAEKKREQAEKLKNRRESNEPQLKTKRVLDRIQHMFDKKPENGKKKGERNIGQLNADELFEDMYGDGDKKKSEFKDSSLTGVSQVLNKVKNKFEAKEEVHAISRGVEKRQHQNPAAMAFEIKEKLAANEDLLAAQASPGQKQQEWTWKKKTPMELAMDSAIYKPSEKEPEETTATAKDHKRRPDEEKQKAILDDIHRTTARLRKKNVLKDHDTKMDEFESFMEEMQDFLNEPNDTQDDAEFKSDIQDYINAMNNEAKSRKFKKGKTSKPVLKLESVNTIKDRLLSKDAAFDDKPGASPKATTQSIKLLQQQLLEQEQADGKSLNKDSSDIKTIGKVATKLFENSGRSNASDYKIRVPKKIIHMPETEQQKNLERSTYEWKYKQKNIEDLQEFLDKNNAMVPDKIRQKLEDVRDNLTDVSSDDSEDDDDDAVLHKDDAKKINEYDELMAEVEEFLNAPDRSTSEVDFKSEIERFMDLIEEPTANAKPQRPKSKVLKKKKPGKLKNLDMFEAKQNDDSRSRSPMQRDKKNVNDLKNKLVQELSKSGSKNDEIYVPSAGTSNIRRNLEKMTREEEVTLLGPRRIKINKDFVVDDGVKSLEELKAEQESTKWKWKEKTVQDLQEYMSAHDQPMNSDILEKLQEAEKDLKEKEATATTKEDEEEIKRIRENKDKEFETFLSEIKGFLRESDAKEDQFRQGLKGYLDLIEEGPKEKPSLYQPRKPQRQTTVGDVSMRKRMLEQQFEDDFEYERPDEDWSGGKVDTSFLDNPSERSPSRYADLDPIIGSMSASSVRKQLEAQFAREDRPGAVRGPRVPKKLIDTSMFEQAVDALKPPTLTKNAEKEWKWKQKNIQDLHNFIASNKELVPKNVSIRKQKSVDEEEEEEEDQKTTLEEVTKQAEENEKFLSDVIQYVNKEDEYDHEDQFKNTIQVYLDLIDSGKDKDENKNSLRLAEGTKRVSRMRDAILQSEQGPTKVRRQQVGKLDQRLLNLDNDEGVDSGGRRSKIGQMNDNRRLLEMKKFLEPSNKEEMTLLPAPRNKLIGVVAPEEVQPVKKSSGKKWSMPKMPQKMPQESQTNTRRQQQQPPKAQPKVTDDDWSYIREIKDEEERKKAILAKYGIKPRPAKPVYSDSSSSEDEDAIPLSVLKNDDLYELYRTRQIADESSPSPERPRNRESGSYSTLRNIMSMVKNSKVGQAFEHSKQFFSSQDQGLNRQDDSDSDEDLKKVRGSCRALRSKFEAGLKEREGGRDTLDAPFPAVTTSRSCTNLKSLFERNNQSPSPSPNLNRRHLGTAAQSTGLVSKHRNSLVEGSRGSRQVPARFVMPEEERGRSRMRERFENKPGITRQRPQSMFVKLERNSSFSKFRDAFEAGKAAELNDEDDLQSPQPTGVKAELEALKHCPRLQKLMRINKPKDPSQSKPSLMTRSSNNLDVLGLDSNERTDMERSKNAIKNLFDSNAGKVTYGGSGENRLRSNGARPKQRQGPPKANAQFTDRKWVFDTINKYFDVIKEDEEEDDSDNEYEDASSMVSSQVSMSASNRSSVAQPEEPQGNYQLQPSKSSSKIRGMVSSIMSQKSGADLNTFKEKLSQRLRDASPRRSESFRDSNESLASLRSNDASPSRPQKLGANLEFFKNFKGSSESVASSRSNDPSPSRPKKLGANLDFFKNFKGSSDSISSSRSNDPSPSRPNKLGDNLEFFKNFKGSSESISSSRSNDASPSRPKKLGASLNSFKDKLSKSLRDNSPRKSGIFKDSNESIASSRSNDDSSRSNDASPSRPKKLGAHLDVFKNKLGKTLRDKSPRRSEIFKDSTESVNDPPPKRFSQIEIIETDYDEEKKKIQPSKSSSKLREMVTSILGRSQSNLSLNAFKENLNQHLTLKKSTESLSGTNASPMMARKMSLNRDPGVQESDCEEEEVVTENNKFIRIPL